MIAFPNAKINLGLHITEKRPDHYHSIDSIFYPIPWVDILEIQKAAMFSFDSSGIDIPGNPDQNLCILAYELLKQDFEISPVRMHLHKAVPIGAGLGGGSADGAFALKMLNQLFELALSTEQLEAYALQLGSDCPFFIQNEPKAVSGRGEIFKAIEVELTGKYIALINPQIHISTKEAYQGIIPKQPTQYCEEIMTHPIQEWKIQLSNDFEASLFPNYPQIKALKDRLYQAGASYASMTGSGSTVYGIFEEEPQFEQQGEEIIFTSILK